MARKVFISFLGTNNYLQTYYELNGVLSSPVRFIQQALIELLCQEWTEEDCVMVFYTGGDNGAYKKNWLDSGHKRFHENEDLESIGLETTLKNMNLRMSINGYEISEGFSEKEIWNIFQCVYDKLQDYDEIYFDVTHAFRSIPIFSAVLFNYARFMKQTRLVSILYGAFEKLGPVYSVKELPLEQRVAPIVDLTSLVELQNTNVAASNFVEFGKIGTIAEQLEMEALQESEKQQSIYNAIQCMKSELTKLDSYIQTCCMNDIRKGEYVGRILNQFDTVMQAEHLQISEKLLLMKIKEHLSKFKPRSTDDNIAAAVEWAYQYDMIQQAYTLGQEFIISRMFFLLREKNPYERNRQKFRLFVANLLSVPEYVVAYEGELAKYPDLAADLLTLPWLVSLRKEYCVLRKNRNVLNHAQGGRKGMALLKKEFRTSFDECIRIINNIKL